MFIASFFLPGISEAQCPTVLQSFVENIGDSPFDCGVKFASIKLASIPASNASYVNVVGTFSVGTKVISISPAIIGLSASYSSTGFAVQGQSNFGLITPGTVLANIEYTSTGPNPIQFETIFPTIATINSISCFGTQAAPLVVPLNMENNYGHILIPSQFSCGSTSTNHGLANRSVKTSWISPITDQICQSITDQSGNYFCDKAIAPCSYQVCVTNPNEDFCGLDEFDIYMIQQQIFTISCFPYYWQLLAADVNNSHSITAADISQIRQVLLETPPTNFPFRWKYLSASLYNSHLQNFGPEIPICRNFNFNWSNCQTISGGGLGYYEDFYNFPTGDVSASCTSCNFQNITTRQSNKDQLLKISQVKNNIFIQSKFSTEIYAGSISLKFPNDIIIKEIIAESDELEFDWTMDDNHLLKIVFNSTSANGISNLDFKIISNEILTENQLKEVKLENTNKINNICINSESNYFQWNLEELIQNEIEVVIFSKDRIILSGIVDGIEIYELTGKLLFKSNERSSVYHFNSEIRSQLLFAKLNLDGKSTLDKIILK